MIIFHYNKTKSIPKKMSETNSSSSHLKTYIKKINNPKPSVRKRHLSTNEVSKDNKAFLSSLGFTVRKK